MLAVQIFFYHHKYPNDHRLYKVVVGDDQFLLGQPNSNHALLGRMVLVGAHSVLRRIFDRIPSTLFYRLVDTMQTTSIAVAAWSYLIRHNGDPETPTEISTYVYARLALLLWLKYVLRQARILYVPVHTIPIKFLT